jgi:hypothetical protein
MGIFRFWQDMLHRVTLKRTDKIMVGNVDSNDADYIDVSELLTPLTTDDLAEGLINQYISSLISDGTLAIDGNLIRANLSSFEERFTWHTGDSTSFALAFTPTNILNIFINGSKLYSDSQFTVTLPNTINILSALADGDVVTIQYEHVII